MFNIYSLIVLFLIWRSRSIFRDKYQISSGESTWSCKRGYEEGAKIRVIFAKFPLLSEIQTLSHKLLVRKTSNHHHCNWYAQKHTCRDFQVISNSSSWSKTCLCIFRNKYGYKIGNAMGKCEMLQIGSIIAPGVQIYKFEADQMSSFPIHDILWLNNRYFS